MSHSGNQDSIISEWLRSLGLQQYAPDFIDNGYDELEVCKLIKDEDLDAIGVTHALHRKIILDSVIMLKCEGATSVYFTLEEARAAANSRQSVARQSSASNNGETLVREPIYDVSSKPNSAFQRTHQSNQSLARGSYSPTVGISIPLSVERLVKDKLAQDGVDLSSPPYTQVMAVQEFLVTLFYYSDAAQL